MSYGIDIPIGEMITNLQAKLWTGNTVSFYGRIFRNETAGSKIIPLYYDTANDYIEVLPDDTKAAMCFVDVQSNETMIGDVYHNKDVRFCFFVNLATLYPSNTRTEATELAHRDAIQYLDHPAFTLKGIVRGWEGFSGYEFAAAIVDMQPFYLFRVDAEILYTINC